MCSHCRLSSMGIWMSGGVNLLIFSFLCRTWWEWDKRGINISSSVLTVVMPFAALILTSTGMWRNNSFTAVARDVGSKKVELWVEVFAIINCFFATEVEVQPLNYCCCDNYNLYNHLNRFPFIPLLRRKRRRNCIHQRTIEWMRIGSRNSFLYFIFAISSSSSSVRNWVKGERVCSPFIFSEELKSSPIYHLSIWIGLGFLNFILHLLSLSLIWKFNYINLSPSGFFSG